MSAEEIYRWYASLFDTPVYKPSFKLPCLMTYKI